MIDGRGFDLPGPRCRGKEQQGEAVGAARYGDADARVGRDQRVEIGAKTLDQGRGLGNHPDAP